MITTIILFIISFFLEGLLPNVLRNITPYFIICIITISPLNVKNDRVLYLTCFISGVIYDLTYTNTLFLHGFIYLFLMLLSKMILGVKGDFIKTFACYILNILIYILIIILFTFFYKSYNIYKIIQMIYDGLIINILYFLLVYLTYFVINCIFKNRLKKRSY